MTTDSTAAFVRAAFDGDVAALISIAPSADPYGRDSQGRTADAAAGMSAINAAKRRIEECRAALAEAEAALRAADAVRRVVRKEIERIQAERSSNDDEVLALFGLA